MQPTPGNIREIVDWLHMDLDSVSRAQICRQLEYDFQAGRPPYIASENKDGRIRAAICVRRLSQQIFRIAAIENSPFSIADADDTEVVCGLLKSLEKHACAHAARALEICLPEHSKWHSFFVESGFHACETIQQLWLDTRGSMLGDTTDSPAILGQLDSHGLRWVHADASEIPSILSALWPAEDITCSWPHASAKDEQSQLLNDLGPDSQWNAWQLRSQAELAGCCLLRHQRGRATEIAFLGLSSSFRAQGLSHLLIAQAVSKSASGGLIAAVDAANLPAVRMYAGARFDCISTYRFYRKSTS